MRRDEAISTLGLEFFLEDNLGRKVDHVMRPQFGAHARAARW
jgi:predicted nucleotidyltransferase